ncbi:response regulator [Streptomyces sp. NPDC059740]|uniref:response regulator n=1 Tax=Streptomyces sp. NPDC059740 TaxID=3346926 RepID=UPI00364F4F40
MTIRVLVVDDQAMVREGFTVLLDAMPDIEVVGEAVNGQEACERSRLLAPDVVLMDIRMPRSNGLEATRRIMAEGSGARVLVLTTFDLDEYVYEALRAGASGFLLKDASARELAEAVRVVAAGEALLAPRVTGRLLAVFARLAAASRPGTRPAPFGGLTQRETEVLYLIARGCSNAEIAASLAVSASTVKTHVGRVLAKLGLRERIQVVIFAYEQGLVAPDAG